MKTGKERKEIRKLKKAGRYNIYKIAVKLGQCRGRPNRIKRANEKALLEATGRLRREKRLAIKELEIHKNKIEAEQKQKDLKKMQKELWKLSRHKRRKIVRYHVGY